jgi:hypothetical protein
VHDHHVIDVTCGSSEEEIEGANPHSGEYRNDSECAVKNALDFEAHSCFRSAYCPRLDAVRHTRDNWLC